VRLSSADVGTTGPDWSGRGRRFGREGQEIRLQLLGEDSFAIVIASVDMRLDPAPLLCRHGIVRIDGPAKDFMGWTGRDARHEFDSS
jgi:hypothetical protein